MQININYKKHTFSLGRLNSMHSTVFTHLFKKPNVSQDSKATSTNP